MRYSNLSGSRHFLEDFDSLELFIFFIGFLDEVIVDSGAAGASFVFLYEFLQSWEILLLQNQSKVYCKVIFDTGNYLCTQPVQNVQNGNISMAFLQSFDRQGMPCRLCRINLRGSYRGGYLEERTELHFGLDDDLELLIWLLHILFFMSEKMCKFNTFLDMEFCFNILGYAIGYKKNDLDRMIAFVLIWV